MKSYGEKVREARERAGMSQAQLARQISLSVRSVTAYETGCARPRGTTARRLADVLCVSVEYLMDDAIQDPAYGMQREADWLNDRYAGGKARADRLLAQVEALFESPYYTQAEKDAFFHAVMTIYVTNREKRRAELEEGDKSL